MTEQVSRHVLMINTEQGWRGGENQVLLLAKGLTKNYIPVVLCPPGSRMAAAAKDAGLSVVEHAMRGQWDIAAIRFLRRYLHEHPIALVHAHTSHAHSLAALALLGRREPLVVTRRVDFPIKRGFIARWKYGRAVTCFAAVSKGVQSVMIAGGVPAERIAVIWDGIDFERFPKTPSSLRSELALPDDALVVGVTAHLTDHKDHQTLLRAFVTVEQQLPQAWLLIVGTGELEPSLKTLAQELDLKRVRFLGFRSDINNVLRGLDLFTLTSHLEGLGSSLMDAMYCSLPVVATRAGGMPELIIEGETGLLAEVRDHTGIAKALITLLCDRVRRSHMSQAAYQRAESHFSAEHMIAGYKSLYDRVCAGSYRP